MTKEFITSQGLREAHAIIRPDNSRAPFDAQLASVAAQIHNFTASGLRPVMVRWFMTDAANQAAAVRAVSLPCAVSMIEQPPLDGSKIAAWIWLRSDVSLSDRGRGYFEAKCSGGYSLLLRASACEPGLTSFTATRVLLDDLAITLEEMGGSLLHNCLRTWFFVRDVDVNYSGVVGGRNAEFDIRGLNTDTHFLASTGICGSREAANILVSMDALGCFGIDPANVRQISAPEYLNPTYEYGVAFERATAVDFPDRRHVYVSGTASIDNKGRVFAPGDIVAQTSRMLRNVEALLEAAGCDFSHVGHFIVYLRDLSDRETVEQIFAERFPDIPHIVVLAPVCRPGWLIETECMAIKPL